MKILEWQVFVELMKLGRTDIIFSFKKYHKLYNEPQMYGFCIIDLDDSKPFKDRILHEFKRPIRDKTDNFDITQNNANRAFQSFLKARLIDLLEKAFSKGGII